MEDMVSKDALQKATKLLKKGGEYFIEGIAILLISKAELEEKGTGGGIKTGELKKGLHQLDGDPFLTLGILITQRLTDSEIKKKWRSLALKYHPDKTQNRTTALFALIQQAYTTLTDPIARTTFEAKFQKSQEDRDRRRSTGDRMSRAYATYQSGGGFGVHGVSATNGMNNPYDTHEFNSNHQTGSRSHSESASRRARPKSAPSRRSSSSERGGTASGCAPPPSYFPKSGSSTNGSSHGGSGTNPFRYTPSPSPSSPNASFNQERDQDRERYHGKSHSFNADNASTGGGSTSGNSSSNRYRNKSRDRAAEATSSDRSTSNHSSGVLRSPSSLKFIERTNESATLTWIHPLFTPANMTKETPLVLFEVNWRERKESNNNNDWEVSSHLLRSNICRKKNLKPSTCYEFRVRATSVQGIWSAFAESAFTVTQQSSDEDNASSSNTPKNKSSKKNTTHSSSHGGVSNRKKANSTSETSQAEHAARAAGQAAAATSNSSTNNRSSGVNKNDSSNKNTTSSKKVEAQQNGDDHSTTASSTSSSNMKKGSDSSGVKAKPRPHSSYQSRRDSYREQYFAREKSTREDFANRSGNNNNNQSSNNQSSSGGDRRKEKDTATSSHHSSVSSSETNGSSKQSNENNTTVKKTAKKEKRQKMKKEKEAGSINHGDKNETTSNTSSSVPLTAVKGTRTEVLRQTLNRLRKAEIDAMKEDQKKMEEKLNHPPKKHPTPPPASSQTSTQPPKSRYSVNKPPITESTVTSNQPTKTENKEEKRSKNSTTASNHNTSVVNNQSFTRTSSDLKIGIDNDVWECMICGRKNDVILNSYRCRACGRANDHSIAHHPFSSPKANQIRPPSETTKPIPTSSSTDKSTHRKDGVEFTADELRKLSKNVSNHSSSTATAATTTKNQDSNSKMGGDEQDEDKKESKDMKSNSSQVPLPPHPINTTLKPNGGERPKSAQSMYRSPSPCSSRGGGANSVNNTSESPSYMRPIGNVMNRRYRSERSMEKEKTTTSPAMSSSFKEKTVNISGQGDMDLNMEKNKDISEGVVKQASSSSDKSMNGTNPILFEVDSSLTGSTATVTSASSTHSKYVETTRTTTQPSKTNSNGDERNGDERNGVDEERVVYTGGQNSNHLSSSNRSSGGGSSIKKHSRANRPSSAPSSRSNSNQTTSSHVLKSQGLSSASYSKLSNEDLNHYVREMEARMQSKLNFTVGVGVCGDSVGGSSAGGAQRAVAAVRQSREDLPINTVDKTSNMDGMKDKVYSPFIKLQTKQVEEEVTKQNSPPPLASDKIGKQRESNEQSNISFRDKDTSPAPSSPTGNYTRGNEEKSMTSPSSESALLTNQRSTALYSSTKIRDLINRANARKDELYKIESILDDLYIARSDSAQHYVKALQVEYPTHPLVLAAIGHCHVAGRGMKADKSLAELFYQQVDVSSLEVLALNKVSSSSLSSRQDDGVHGSSSSSSGGGGIQSPKTSSKRSKEEELLSQGSAHAQFHLGYMLQWGKGPCMKDVQSAVEWYRKAAVQGHANAQCNLGVCLYYGQGVDMNEIEAAMWFSKSANQGHAKAQCNLGVCYKKGRGVPRDDSKALDYYTLSAAQGDVDATAALERLKLRKERKKKESSGSSLSARGGNGGERRSSHHDSDQESNTKNKEEPPSSSNKGSSSSLSTGRQFRAVLGHKDSSTSSSTSKGSKTRQRPKSAGVARSSSFTGEN